MASSCSDNVSLLVIQTSAPGNLMLMGEHAVLKGHRALACAVDKRISLKVTEREDRRVCIDSQLEHYTSDLDQLVPSTALNFMLIVIAEFAQRLTHGFDIRVESEFSHTVGLGSSAAVTAATTAAMLALEQRSADVSPALVFDHALAAVHKAQGGRGSGTDLAATIYGGVVGYTQSPRAVVSYSQVPKIRLHYVGYKMKTPDVIKKVDGLSESDPSFYTSLYQLMHHATVNGEACVSAQDWRGLAHWMNVYQGLMDALGVNDAQLADLISRSRAEPSTLAAKISGSGLGDCVISLIDEVMSPSVASVDGHQSDLGYQEIVVGVSPRGVECEFI